MSFKEFAGRLTDTAARFIAVGRGDRQNQPIKGRLGVVNLSNLTSGRNPGAPENGVIYNEKFFVKRC
jgi:hypothetical protein